MNQAGRNPARRRSVAPARAVEPDVLAALARWENEGGRIEHERARPAAREERT
jgi:hypothetical protein